MKKVFLIVGVLALLIVFALFGIRSYTKSFSPTSQLVFNEGSIEGQVVYCRPFKKDRDIFGKLVPYGEVWRTGANEATEITFENDLNFGGKALKAGTYTLFTIPNPTEWTIILNSKLGQWGAFNYKSEFDVLRVEVPTEEADKVHEQFTIAFEAKSAEQLDMLLTWDKTRVRVALTAN